MVTVTSPPVVALQAPKDVSIDEIEAELKQIWHSYGQSTDGMAVTRATTFNFLVYEPDLTQQLMSALGYYTGPIDGIYGPRMNAAIQALQKNYGFPVTGKSDQALLSKLKAEFANLQNHQLRANYSLDGEGAGIADAIAAENPCRIITLCPNTGEDQGVSAQVSAYCPVQKQQKNSLICCEYITLKGTSEALERISGIISELMISDLPKLLWWKASPDLDYCLLKRLTKECQKIIFDSSSFSNSEIDLLKLGELLNQGIPIADLNWSRIAPWQELTAEAFDPPERRANIWEVDGLTLDYEKGNPAQALMFLGWIASRLQWQPLSYVQEGGDYDIRKITFLSKDQKTINVELAGIPTADVGDIPGDLISLRLSSTNLEADCCTVLCSETTGCMRMEAKGGAQACRIQQVTPLFDQKTEHILGQQIQRWGQDFLYKESMTVTYEILKLAQNS